MSNDLTVMVLAPQEGFDEAVVVAADRAVLSKFTALAQSPSLPFLVEVKVRLEGEQYVADEVKVRRRTHEPPIKSESLRDLPVAEIIRLAAMKIVLGEVPFPGQNAVACHVIEKRKDAPLRPTPEVLADVAILYRLGLMAGGRPTAFVAESLGLPRSTAGRWVARAREEGLLEPKTFGPGSQYFKTESPKKPGRPS